MLSLFHRDTETLRLTDIWRFVRAIWTVLLPITAPAFGDTGHLVLAHKLFSAAGFGLIVCFGICEKREKLTRHHRELKQGIDTGKNCVHSSVTHPQAKS